MAVKSKQLKNQGTEEPKNQQTKEPKDAAKKKTESMASLMEELGDDILPFKEGDLIEATILAVSGDKIWVDVSGQSLGFIPEREISSKAGLKKGDKIFASVLSMDDAEGNVVLSMRQADREKYWGDMQAKFESKEAVTIRISDANKGGLVTEIGGIQGFLPVSQLSPQNYPRVSGGDKDEILNRLRQFIGKDVVVKVINCDKEAGKLIFSEKAVSAEEVKNKVDKYKVGDKVKGRITGIVDFGLFISIEPQIEGLVHISEISWSRVTDLSRLYKVGDEIEALVITVENGRISLSIKRLHSDPWVEAAAKYKVGDKVKGQVSKITAYGAFVSIEDGIDGLVHVSELSEEHVVDPGQVVGLGKEYEYKIISIEPESHRLGLSLKAAAQTEKIHPPAARQQSSSLGGQRLRAGKKDTEKKETKRNAEIEKPESKKTIEKEEAKEKK
jgi:ribosomal protein S1